VRPRPVFPFALLRSPLVWCALLLVGSCLNPQPDPFPQAAGSTPGGERNGPNDSNAFAGDQPGPSVESAPSPTAAAGAPESQPPAPQSAPAPVAPGAGAERDAGVPEPDGGQPDAATPVNDAF
jgi:hypothetical protein